MEGGNMHGTTNIAHMPVFYPVGLLLVSLLFCCLLPSTAEQAACQFENGGDTGHFQRGTYMGHVTLTCTCPRRRTAGRLGLTAGPTLREGAINLHKGHAHANS